MMNRPLPLFLFAALLLSILGGCTRHYYGVAEDDWHRMSEEERREVIRIYQERRMYEARRRAAEAERRAAETAYTPSYPEWVHVHLSGGVFIYKGRRYAYHAHDLRLRQGEVRVIELVSINTSRPYRVKLWLRYHEGRVMLGDGRQYLRSFDYRDSWKRGDRYTGIKMRGDLQLEGVDMRIGADERDDRKGNRAAQGEDGPQRARANPPLKGGAAGRAVDGRGVPTEERNLPEKAMTKQQQILQERVIREKEQEAQREERAAQREERAAEKETKRVLQQQEQEARKEAVRERLETRREMQMENRNNAGQPTPPQSRGAARKVLTEQAPQDEKAEASKALKAKKQAAQLKAKGRKAEAAEKASPACVEAGEKGNGKKKDLPECEE